MNVFRLLELASERLTTNDAFSMSKPILFLASLRSAGVLPHKRSSLNGSSAQVGGSYDRASL